MQIVHAEVDMTTRTRQTVEELLHQEHYTPQELADLLGMRVEIIYHAAFQGDLRAEKIGHDVVDIRREDALAWLQQWSDDHAAPAR
jgi:hypothetical protein